MAVNTKKKVKNQTEGGVRMGLKRIYSCDYPACKAVLEIDNFHDSPQKHDYRIVPQIEGAMVLCDEHKEQGVTKECQRGKDDR